VLRRNVRCCLFNPWSTCLVEETRVCPTCSSFSTLGSSGAAPHLENPGQNLCFQGSAPYALLGGSVGWLAGRLIHLWFNDAIIILKILIFVIASIIVIIALCSRAWVMNRRNRQKRRFRKRASKKPWKPLGWFVFVMYLNIII
jgi:hypothetical protein